MSRMSQPTPIYNTTRAEDMANLNRILLTLSMDERARILTTGSTTLTRGATVASATATDTITTNYSPYVIAFMTQDNTNYYPLPFLVITTGAALAITEAVTMETVTNAAGITTVTFKAVANDTVKANSDIYYIYYIAFKDKIVPTN